MKRTNRIVAAATILRTGTVPLLLMLLVAIIVNTVSSFQLSTPPPSRARAGGRAFVIHSKIATTTTTWKPTNFVPPPPPLRPRIPSLVLPTSLAMSSGTNNNDDDKSLPHQDEETNNEELFSSSSEEDTMNISNSSNGDGDVDTNDNDDWFEPIRKDIEAKYARVKVDMERELEEKRLADPSSVPDNADLLMETVWQLEMEEEIQAERNKAAEALLEDYERGKRQETERVDLTGTEDSEVAQEVLQELSEQEEQRAAAQARMDEFMRYEQESFRKAAQKEIVEPNAGGDLDEWALERLEDMLSSTAEDDVEVADNLEENIQELRSKIEKEKKKGSIRPETLKEWQMYRAIATRLLEDEASEKAGTEEKPPPEDEGAIVDQLESWKSYEEKEKKVRSRSGLSRGPKMPFDWYEAGPRPRSSIDLEEPLQPVDDQRSRKEIRADVNRQAIEVLEGLLQNSVGTPREASLRQNLEDLISGMEEDLAAEDDDAGDAVSSAGPIDVSDVFARGGSAAETASPIFSKVEETDVISPPSTPFFSQDEEDVIVDSAPPDTPFFAPDFDEGVVTASDSPPERPNTPFFSDDEEDFDVESGELDSSKLGTLEEQRLRRMYRRAGAVTADEQERIKSEWEQFQILEKKKRDRSGLSDDESTLGEADLKYDINDVIKDGDIDAEKVLSSIGPRPTRTRKRDTDGASRSSSTASGIASSAVESPPVDSTDVDEDEQQSGTSQVKSDDIVDPMFRSISAVGGGRTKDDPEAKAKEKSAFEEFVLKQAQVRESLDEIDSTLVNKTLEEALEELGFEETPTSSEALDDESYSSEVLASVGSRPKRERQMTREEYERVFSDNGGAHSDDEDETESSATEEDLLVPEWMRKAKDGGGSELDSLKTLDFDDEEHQRNMQQLREYEQRRAAQRPRQMGIDISEVLGRSVFSDDDYAREAQRGWEQGRSFSGFESRKANLLEYTELDVAELNLLMDTKNAVQTTGVSQYLPRIKKPFKDFGAIFRMEGVLVDVTGFEYEAWTKTAEVYGFKPPVLEDVKLAAVSRPEIAARKIFFWTDDFLMCKEIARTQQEAMKDVFSTWMRENSVAYVEPEPVMTANGEKARSEDILTPFVPASSDSDTDRQMRAWSRTAEKYGFPVPSLDEVLFASVVSADDAVTNAFRWTNDRNQALDIVRTYQNFLSNGGEVNEDVTAGGTNVQISHEMDTEPPRSRDTLSESELLEVQYKAWLKVAEKYGLDPPTPDEALGAMVINDPSLVVRDGFGWTDDPTFAIELVWEYESSVRQQLRDWSGDTGAEVTEEETPMRNAAGSNQDSESNKERQTSTGPTQEEVTEMKAYAWMTAAETHGCDEPRIDDFQAALYADPEYAVKEVYRWTDDDDKARAVAATYQEELDKMSKEYIEKNKLDVVPMTPKVSAPKPNKPEGPSSGELFQAASDAWKQVAEKRGYSEPNADQIQFSLAVGPEDALDSFQWTTDPDERKEIVEEYVGAVRQASSRWESGYELGLKPKTTGSPRDDKTAPYTVIPGASQWLQSLVDVEMPCGLISHLEREQVDVLLDQAGLARFFPADKRVTASNGYELEEQQMLGASLRLERRPDHCVVFDASPSSSVAAHDVDMKSVCMVGVYPMYELLSADSTVRSLDDLTAMNVRRLFGERIYDQPMVQSKEDLPDLSRRATTKTRFWEEGDRD